MRPYCLRFVQNWSIKSPLLIVTAKDKLRMQNSMKMNWKLCVICSVNTGVVSVQVILNICLTSVSRLQLTAELKNRV
jgi:hypothetical protein